MSFARAVTVAARQYDPRVAAPQTKTVELDTSLVERSASGNDG